MADDLATDIFKTARIQHERIVRWHLIVLAALLYLHLGIILPFAHKSAEKDSVDLRLAEQREILTSTLTVSAAAQQLGEGVRNAADEISSFVVLELVARFKKLDERVAALPDMPDGAADAAQDLAPIDFSGPQQQQQQQQQQLRRVLPAFVPELARLISRYGNSLGGAEHFQLKLDAYIEEFVVKPVFDEARGIWDRRYVQRIDDLTRTAMAALNSAKETDHASKELIQLESSIEMLNQRVHAVDFTPPHDAGWWRTVIGKEDTIKRMLARLAADIEGVGHSTVNLETLRTQVEATVSESEMLSKEIEAEIKRLQEDAKDLQSQLGEIGGPLKVVSFELDVLGPLLPAIIAVASGIFSLMTSESLRKMSFAVTVAGAQSGSAELKPWLADAAGRSAWKMTAKLAVFSCAMGFWIIAAVFDVMPLEPAFLSHASVAAIALAVYIACRVLLWKRAAAAIRIAAPPV